VGTDKLGPANMLGSEVSGAYCGKCCVITFEWDVRKLMFVCRAD